MSKQDEGRKPESRLSPEDLEAQQGEELPDRKAMSVFDPGVDGGFWHIMPVEPPSYEEIPVDRV